MLQRRSCPHGAHRAKGATLALLSVFTLARSSPAQIHDHLKCFKIKDSASFSAVVDLRPLEDGEFGVDGGCTLKVKSREVCFPVEKDLVSTDAPSQVVGGVDLSNAFLCYKVHCPSETTPESLDMSDQFGTRMISGLRTTTVCAPAVIGDPPPTTTTTTLPHGPPRNCVDATAPNCDGTCGSSDSACIEQSGACVCQFYEPFSSCGLVAGAPTCYGQCAGSQSCIEVSGACHCGDVFEPLP